MKIVSSTLKFAAVSPGIVSYTVYQNNERVAEHMVQETPPLKSQGVYRDWKPVRDDLPAPSETRVFPGWRISIGESNANLHPRAGSSYTVSMQFEPLEPFCAQVKEALGDALEQASDNIPAGLQEDTVREIERKKSQIDADVLAEEIIKLSIRSSIIKAANYRHRDNKMVFTTGNDNPAEDKHKAAFREKRAQYANAPKIDKGIWLLKLEAPIQRDPLMKRLVPSPTDWYLEVDRDESQQVTYAFRVMDESLGSSVQPRQSMLQPRGVIVGCKQAGR